MVLGLFGIERLSVVGTYFGQDFKEVLIFLDVSGLYSLSNWVHDLMYKVTQRVTEMAFSFLSIFAYFID